MKNILTLLLLTFIISSCVDNTFESIEQLEKNKTIQNKKTTAISSADSLVASSDLENYSTADPLEDTDPHVIDFNLSNKLNIYSYILGHVITKHTNASNEIISNLPTNNIINLNSILTNNNTLKNAFLTELNTLTLSTNVTNASKGGPKKVIVTILGNDMNGLTPQESNLILYNACMQIKTEIETNSFNDCLELYVAKPIYFQYPQFMKKVHITPHSLLDITFPIGYIITYSPITDGTNMYSSSFNDLYYNTHPSSIVVVRPVRNTTCLYSDVDVIDFNTYYQSTTY